MAELSRATLDPRPFRLLIDDAVRWTRRYFLRLFPWAALPMVSGMVLLAVVQVRWMGSLFSFAEEPDLLRFFGGYALILVSSLLFGLIAALTALATTASAVDAVAGRPVSMVRSWRLVLEPKVLATSLLVGFLCFVGFTFMALPGIYAMLALAFVMPVMVEEGSRLGAAMGRSFQLTHQTPLGWLRSPLVKMLVVMVVAYLLNSLLGLFIQLPFSVAQQLLIVRDSLAAGESLQDLRAVTRWTWLQVPASFFGGLTAAAVMIYSSFATALLYRDSRLRQEGWDLESALAELESTAPPRDEEPA